MKLKYYKKENQYNRFVPGMYFFIEVPDSVFVELDRVLNISLSQISRAFFMKLEDRYREYELDSNNSILFDFFYSLCPDFVERRGKISFEEIMSLDETKDEDLAKLFSAFAWFDFEVFLPFFKEKHVIKKLVEERLLLQVPKFFNIVSSNNGPEYYSISSFFSPHMLMAYKELFNHKRFLLERFISYVPQGSNPPTFVQIEEYWTPFLSLVFDLFEYQHWMSVHCRRDIGEQCYPRENFEVTTNIIDSYDKFTHQYGRKLSFYGEAVGVIRENLYFALKDNDLCDYDIILDGYERTALLNQLKRLRNMIENDELDNYSLEKAKEWFKEIKFYDKVRNFYLNSGYVKVRSSDIFANNPFILDVVKEIYKILEVD